jgi:hypothetical protein
MTAPAPSSAQAEEACPSTFAPAFQKWSYPSPLAWGRSGVVSARRPFSVDWDLKHLAVGVGNQEPSEHSGLGLKYDAGDLTLPITIRRGSPGVRLRFKWTIERVQTPVELDHPHAIQSCEQTKEIFVKGDVGKKRSFRESPERGVGLIFWNPVGTTTDKRDCASLAVVPATLTVSDGRATRSVGVRDQCVFNSLGNTSKVTRSAKSWYVTASPLTGFALAYTGLTSASFRYRLSVGNEVVRKGTLTAHVRSTPDRIIWEGTDDFVNVCINQLRKIRSKNLRLYCVAPGSYSVTFTRKP